MFALWKKSYDQPRQHIKKQRHYFANKGLSCQSYGFSSSHVWMWELDYKVEHQRIDALELWYPRRLLRIPWTARKSNQSIQVSLFMEILQARILKSVAMSSSSGSSQPRDQTHVDSLPAELPGKPDIRLPTNNIKLRITLNHQGSPNLYLFLHSHYPILWYRGSLQISSLFFWCFDIPFVSEGFFSFLPVEKF